MPWDIRMPEKGRVSVTPGMRVGKNGPAWTENSVLEVVLVCPKASGKRVLQKKSETKSKKGILKRVTSLRIFTSCGLPSLWNSLFVCRRWVNLIVPLRLQANPKEVLWNRAFIQSLEPWCLETYPVTSAIWRSQLWTPKRQWSGKTEKSTLLLKSIFRAHPIPFTLVSNGWWIPKDALSDSERNTRNPNGLFLRKVLNDDFCALWGRIEKLQSFPVEFPFWIRIIL